MSENSVSVVIVNYNGERFLPECLGAVIRQTVKPAEIIVVDNGSTDRSVEIVRSSFPGVDLIVNKENFYFCKGSNIGIAKSSGSFVLLLNNDCIIEPGYIEELLKPMLRDEEIGSTTGKILRIEGNTIDTAGQELSRSRKPLDRGYGLPDDGRYDEDEEVFSAGGVAPLLRRKMLDDVAIDSQFFDEDFVQYYEDLDLQWRSRNLGWKAWYNPLALARHLRGASGQSEPAMLGWVRKFALANLPVELQGHLLKNRYATMAKNDNVMSWLASLPWIAAYEFKVIAYLLLIRPSLIPRYFKGFGSIGKALAKRKELKQRAGEKRIKRYGGRHKIH